MGRSRNIKPGFFKNDLLAEIDPLGRILFAGLWCIADREGRLEDRPKRIKAEVLPYDQCDVSALLDTLADSGFILRYQVNSVCYIQIQNWAKHQHPHVKEAASEIPAPANICAAPEIPVLAPAFPEQAPNQHITNPLDSLNLIPDSLNLIPDSLKLIADAPTSAEQEILVCLNGVKGYPLDHMTDLAYIRTLEKDFPDVDIASEVKKWAVYKLDKPLQKKSNPRSQLRSWMSKVIIFDKGGRINAHGRDSPTAKTDDLAEFIQQ